MTPAARVAAAIGILDRILAGSPAEPALLGWARSSRYAGSGDRAAVRDLVFDSLRRMRSQAALGGAMTGRGLMIGHCRAEGIDPDSLFTGGTHAPAPLSDAERSGGVAPRDLVALDLPDWLGPPLRKALGPDFAPVMRAMRDRAPLWLRINPRRASGDLPALLKRDGIAVEPGPGLSLRVTSGERRVQQSEAYRSGAVEIQDLSSQLAAALLPLPPAGSVLDYCAGGGGKTLALAARGGSGPVFSAHDIDPARMSDLPQRAKRAGVKVEILPPGGARGRHDLVLVDAPCSGSGTWRRTPDAKWRLTPQRLEELSAIQADILSRSAELTAPGGALAYMTCSFLGEENDDQVRRFLAGHPEFSLEARRAMTPLCESDGFFVAVMRKND